METIKLLLYFFPSSYLIKIENAIFVHHLTGLVGLLFLIIISTNYYYIFFYLLLLFIIKLLIIYFFIKTGGMALYLWGKLASALKSSPQNFKKYIDHGFRWNGQVCDVETKTPCICELDST